MSVMKKFGLSVLFVVLMYFGGLGTQSEVTAYQGAGAASVMVAFVLLFVLFKVIKTNMGAFSSFIVFGGIMLFILYSLGWLKNINSAIQSKEAASVEDNGAVDEQNSAVVETQAADEEGGFFAKLFGNSGENNGNLGFNPEDYPAVEGYAEAITGDMLDINGLHVKLLGIESPYMQQTCADKFGQGYACGQKSRNWLQDWLQGKMVKCHIISPQNNGRATGVCFAEGYDIGAVVVNAGWAVAYTKNTDVYVPYEQQAGRKKRGLWAGTFYKPWDWKKLQSRKVDIKIQKNSNDSVGDSVGGSFGNILGAF